MLDNQELDKAHFNAVPASEDQESVLTALCTESLFWVLLKERKDMLKGLNVKFKRKIFLLKVKNICKT